VTAYFDDAIHQNNEDVISSVRDEFNERLKKDVLTPMVQ